MSEESERLRRTVDRLMDAHQEALEVTSQALDAEVEGWDEDEPAGINERLQVALVDQLRHVGEERGHPAYHSERQARFGDRTHSYLLPVSVYKT